MAKHSASLYDTHDDGAVSCRLCGKKCRITPGNSGFCTVRKNEDGKLVTINYGESTYFVRDSIETEGVFHYRPGCLTIEVGTYGCNLHCDFCQNWRYSRADTVKLDTLVEYTPQQLVDRCIEMKIDLIAWTFNDPTIWYEFVMDTSELAGKHGIKCLFKSSSFISLEALENLAKHIDVFSVSLKSIRDDFYRSLCTGWIDPVRDAIQYLAGRKDKHLEISNLMIPTLNDDEEQIRELVGWVMENAGVDVPLHFVRYHPDYKFTIPRTPEPIVARAREIALEMGMNHVYIGNSFSHQGLSTWCAGCGEQLIFREGRRCEIKESLDQTTASCRKCGRKVNRLVL